MLREKINIDLKQAMRAKDTNKLSVLRLLISAFNNEAISLKKKDEGLTDDEELKVIKREVKKRKDSIEQYTAGGRSELADQEKKELEILQAYLPAEMSEEQVRKIVVEVVAEMGEIAPSQFGQVMGQVMAKTQGQADGALVSRIVKETINK